MARSLNKKSVIGYVGADGAVVRYRPGEPDKPQVFFSVATNESFKNKESGENVDATEWHSIAVFGPLAKQDWLHNLSSGQQVYVCGPTRVNKSVATDGTHYARDTLVANEIILLGAKKESTGGGNAGGNAGGDTGGDN